MDVDVDSAKFGWYKDVALSVSVFTLVVVGLSAFFEPSNSIVGQHRVGFAAGVFVSAIACTLFATSRRVVVGTGLAIMLFRSVVAIVLQPAIGRPVFVAIALISGALIYRPVAFRATLGTAL